MASYLGFVDVAYGDPERKGCLMTVLYRSGHVLYKCLRCCRLMTDSAFCLDLMSRVCKAGFAIEEALGSAQDVEGAVEEDGAITVVQTRPQM